MSKYKPITITPKEKAEQLLELSKFGTRKYIDRDNDNMKIFPNNIYYVECARAITNEILQFMKDDDNESETYYWANHPKTSFWVEVEKEIKNMYL